MPRRNVRTQVIVALGVCISTASATAAVGAVASNDAPRPAPAPPLTPAGASLAPTADPPEATGVVDTGPELSQDEADQRATSVAQGLSSDGGPASREIVKTSRERAVPLLVHVRGPSVEQSSPAERAWNRADVYFELFSGHFVYPGAARPPGAPAPQGTTLMVVTDAHTGNISAIAVGPDRPSDMQLQAVGNVAHPG